MSEILKLSKSDFIKGLIVTALSSALTVIATAASAASTTGSLTIDWKIVGFTAISSMIGYLLKQVGTDETGKFIGKV